MPLFLLAVAHISRQTAVSKVARQRGAFGVDDGVREAQLIRVEGGEWQLEVSGRPQRELISHHFDDSGYIRGGVMRKAATSEILQTYTEHVFVKVLFQACSTMTVQTDRCSSCTQIGDKLSVRSSFEQRV